MNPAISDIQRIVAQYYSISKDDFLGRKRCRKIAHPRQLAMYLARELTNCSFPDIGRRFGGRDHTTVLHAKRAVERRWETEPLASDVAIILDRIIHGTPTPPPVTEPIPIMVKPKKPVRLNAYGARRVA